MSEPLRIAMWSGPRNISTAMMRAWEIRANTAVWDEPLYAYYLQASGSDHPGREAIIEAGEADWRKVVAACLGPVPGGRPIFFQKHMTHHLLPEMDWDWLARVHNCFLIRDPREVIASYAKVRSTVTVEDVGVPQQAAIVRHVQTLTGRTPLILDAKDVLQSPADMLHALCEALGCAFDEAMLHWPPGPRDSDGVWAPYWYHSVHASTGFAPYVPRNPQLAPHLKPLAESCMGEYEQLHELRLRG